MALYDGFFDAVLDEETGQYDREYDSSDFTGYFGELIGSGVCVYENPDSFRVRCENGEAVLSPGYLFLQGYWLRNDADYFLPLPGPGVFAVLAHLNLGQRTIELLAQEKTETGIYPDSLVLAYVTVSYDGLPAAAEDTREDMSVCGVIDAVGSLSSKVRYALDYIDNEIDKKLAEAEASIAAQSARLDLKIAEVAALVEELEPPPVGTVKFSAAPSVGAEWLRCDGAFVSAADYPELVEALGKLTPGASEFWEAYNGAAGSGMTNGCLYEGTCWTFSVTDKRLYGYTGSTKTLKALSVTGADRLTASAANPVCLSIADGHLFLAQNQTSANAFVLLECAAFTGSGAVAMTELDVKPVIQAYGTGLTVRPVLPGESFVPEAVRIPYDWGTSTSPDVQDTFAVCMGWQYIKPSANQNTYQQSLYALIWKKDDFSSAKIIRAYSYTSTTSIDVTYARTLFRYSRKNDGELVTIDEYYSGGTIFKFCSVPSGVYNTISNAVVESAAINDPILTSPVAGNGRYIYRCYISGGKLYLRAGKYNPNEPYVPGEPTVAAPALPSRANVFPDSVCYAANQDLWFVFAGTGIAFSQTPEVGASWGYLDTQDVLGVITQFGSLEYDPETNLLYISGQDTLNKGRLGVMQLPELYNFANDGAWLPMIASDGIPAYIKALGSGGAEAPDNTLRVTVLEPPAGYQPSTLSSVAVVFNGTILGVGTSDRTVDTEKGTFTAGLRILLPLTQNYRASLYVNGSVMATISLTESAGTESTVTLNIADYIASGVTLQWRLN